MFLPFHPVVAHALTAVLPTMSWCHNMSLSSVMYCINIKHRQNSVEVRQADSRSVRVQSV